MSSLISDFIVRVAPKSTIRAGTAERLPLGFDDTTAAELTLRVLRLNCLTVAFADIWEEVFDPSFREDAWTGGLVYTDRPALGGVGSIWSESVPLRRAADRRQALLEIDALVAVALGISADELCTIYRTQFPVLHGYDTRSTYYDANGRIVPTSALSAWRRKGHNGGSFALGELCEVHPGSGRAYEYAVPFVTLDREQDLRTAYAEFRRRAATCA